MPMSLLEAAVTLNTKAETWQGSGNTDTLLYFDCQLGTGIRCFRDFDASPFLG